MIRINAHSHLLPEPGEIPDFIKNKGLFSIDPDKSFMRQFEWSRPITDKSFFFDEKIKWMEYNKIDHAVVLNLSQLYCNGWEKQQAMDTIRWQNDFNASVQSRRPDLFTAGFVVQPAYIDAALKEMNRCVNELNLHVLCLPTHFQNEKQEWLSVADQSVFPLFEEASALNLAIEIHPYDAERMIGLKDLYWRFHLVWMMAQTADTLHMYTLLDFAERFPGVRTCFAHGCMLGQANVGRRIQGVEGRPDLFPDTSHPAKSVAHPRIFFDSLVHDLLTFELLHKRSGSSQILAGLDDPYPLGEMEIGAISYPGKILEDARSTNLISQAEFNSIWYDNILHWLGKSHLS